MFMSRFIRTDYHAYRFSYHTGSDRHGKESRRLMCTRASAAPPLPYTYTSGYAVPVPCLDKEEGDANHLRYGTHRKTTNQLTTGNTLYFSRVENDTNNALIWSVSLYRANTWTMTKEDVKRIEAYEVWIWRRIKRISWTEHNNE